MRYLQPLAIVLLLALAIADHWPSRDADAALPMSAYATKQGVCKMVSAHLVRKRVKGEYARGSSPRSCGESELNADTGS